MMAGTVWLPVCFVTREKSVHAAALIASNRHQGTSQSANERRGVATGDAPGWDGKANNVSVNDDWCHESQPYEAAIPQRERADNVRGKH